MRWNWSLIRKVVLTLLILLSLYLSGIIWRNPGDYNDNANEKDNTPRTSVTFNRNISQVFGPSSIVLHDEGSSQLTNRSKTLSSLNKMLDEWQLSNLSDPAALKKADYRERLTQSGDTIELIFPGNIPFGLYEKFFDFLPNDIQNRTFNRVYFSVSNPTEAYFYNTDSGTFYQAEVEQDDEKDLRELTKSIPEEAYSVKSYEVNGDIVYLPVKEINVPYYSYMVEQQPHSLFIERLFEDTSEVQTIRKDQLIRYFDYFSELSIDEETNILTYHRSRTSGDEMSLPDRFKDSFNELLLYENWPNDVFYTKFSSVTNEISFRRYLKDLPIFGDVKHGVTFIGTTETGLTSLQVPLIVAQTPISNEEEDKKMLSGDELMSRLQSVGYGSHEVSNITLGFTWKSNKQSARVVNFEPEWYVELHGNWLRAKKLIEDGGGSTDGL